MTKKIAPLLAASMIAASSAGGAQAAATDQNATATAAVVAAPAPKASKGLCERLGGIFGIAKVTDLFSDAILTNAVLNQNPALVQWNQTQAPTRLPGLKVMRTIWIADKAGCQGVRFFGLPLNEAHPRFNLTPAQFAEVGSEIVKALQTVGAAQADIDELVAIYTASMDDVVSSTEPKAVSPRR